MNLEDLDIPTQVKFLQSQLVKDKFDRMMRGGVFLNDEFILTVGEEEFIYLMNLEADNIEDNNRIERKYSEAEQKQYEKKLVELGFLEVKRRIVSVNYIVRLDKLCAFFDSTNKSIFSNRAITDFIDDLIRYN